MWGTAGPWVRLPLDTPVESGALPRVLAVALWDPVVLVGTWTAMRSPWYAPERWGSAAAVLVRAARQRVRVVSCMVDVDTWVGSAISSKGSLGG